MSALKFALRGLSSADGVSPRQTYVRLLSDFLQPNSAAKPDEVAATIDQQNPLKRGDGDASSTEDFVWGFWDDIDQIARQIPHEHPSQDKLVDVISALKTLPPTTINVWGNEQRLWADLPLAAAVFRDAWIGPQEGDLSSQEQWVNKNAFFARLFGAGVVPWKPNLAVWTMRDALESDKAQPKDLRDCYISAASTWIDYAGKFIYAWTTSGQSDEKLVSITSPGELFKGSAGLNSERWMFWKSRFESIATEVDGDEMRNKVQETAKKMAAIDGN